jgi:hypothetical protein
MRSLILAEFNAFLKIQQFGWFISSAAVSLISGLALCGIW